VWRWRRTYRSSIGNDGSDCFIERRWRKRPIAKKAGKGLAHPLGKLEEDAWRYWQRENLNDLAYVGQQTLVGQALEMRGGELKLPVQP